MHFIVKNEGDLDHVAAHIESLLQAQDALLLHGDLGAGKTALARRLIRRLAGDENLEVPSPTFTLVQSYETSWGAVHHFDLYRLRDPEELHGIGWDEARADIVMVEWPERLGSFIPSPRLDITIRTVKNEPDARDIFIERTGRQAD